ncbi:hypothetical protein [Micromonospora violae]|uniref:hypothetical protein n=1 Tax=Micromonospora violae TaxID=1278207 RepID=UPI00340178E1
MDLRIKIEGVTSFDARISATPEFWTLSNLSADASITVMNMDDWYQYVLVEPRRMSMPVPFEVAQIELTALPDGPKLAVFGHEPQYYAAQVRPPTTCATTSRRPLLDREATYYTVLKELSKDRLNGIMETSLPTSAEIAERLSPTHRTITSRAVDAHIKYVSDKLRLPKGANRDALVAFAIRSSLVSLHS